MVQGVGSTNCGSQAKKAHHENDHGKKGEKQCQKSGEEGNTRQSLNDSSGVDSLNQLLETAIDQKQGEDSKSGNKKCSFACQA